MRVPLETACPVARVCRPTVNSDRVDELLDDHSFVLRASRARKAER